MRTKKRWSDLTRPQRALVLAVGSVQVALAVSAWVDLARRPAARVHGSKRVWAALIGINTIGPVAYFAKGRR